MQKYYTGIGSRRTPEHIIKLQHYIGDYLFGLGYTLRSGGADGSDLAFEHGADLGYEEFFAMEHKLPPPHPDLELLALINACYKEIYLPWKGFNHSKSNKVPPGWANFDQAVELVRKYHPAFHNLQPSHIKLHGRNMYQVLGSDLNTPSQFVVCYTQEAAKAGGTATALNCAEDHGIHICNLGESSIERILSEFIQNKGSI